MPKVNRFEKWDADALGKPQKLPNGFWRVEGRMSRTGIQLYEDGGGRMRRELRRAQDVFAPASLESFKLVPVTNTHPPMLLDSKTARPHAVGSVGENLRRDGDWVVAPMMLIDDEAISALQCGRSQLSCGYSCTLDETPGVDPDFGEYDAIQTEIVGNHLALVDMARAGADAAVRLDADDARMVASPKNGPQRTEKPMPQTITIDGITLEVSDANAPAIQQAITRSQAAAKALHDAEKLRADEAAGDRSRLVTAIHKFRAKWDGIKAKADAMKARMVGCDECDGTGKVMDAAGGKEEMCGYCDGAGKFRMHDKFPKEAIGENGEANEGDGFGGDDVDADEPEEETEDAVTELEAEEGTEEEAKKAHKDVADRRKRRRADAATRREKVKKAAKERADSIARRIDRAARQRIALEVKAREILGPKAKLDGLDPVALKKMVVCKLDAVDAKKLDAMVAAKPAGYLEMRYDFALERLKEKGAGPSAADRARAGTAAVVTNDGGEDTTETVEHEDGEKPLDPHAARELMLKRQREDADPKKAAAKK